MTRSTRPRMRIVGVLACLGLLAGMAGWSTPAVAGPAEPRTTISVALARTDHAGHRLPRAATRSRVVTRLRAHGFRVLRVNSWSISANAPRSLVRATFGAGATATRARTVLGAGVSAVVPDQVGLMRPMVATSGADYRNAYAASSTSTSPVTHGNTVSTGDGAGNTTIATIQFAQFDAADLTRYAASVNRPDPVASGQYTGVVVDGGPSSGDDATEVALDQQAIFATAPTARQRAYFAPNTITGFVDALQQVINDAATHHITALSISWGNCEPAYGTANMTLLDNYLATLQNSKGVTVFSSSGDSGIYGCRTTSGALANYAAVTYPASSPYVVGVGGTRLSPLATSIANNGSNWVESAWSCSSVATCDQGGSGGGASAAYSRPSWQTDAGAGSQRLVPDIAAVGDPATAFVLTQCGSRYQVGGTSLSSPVVAALLTDALGEAGWTSGVGDIHGALYQASSSTPTTRASLLRDITSGSNGPSSSAAAGYDPVTGVGAVLWPKFVDTYFPNPSASAPTLPASSANAVTWPLCGVPTSTSPTGPTAPTPVATAGPTARASLAQSRTRHQRARIRATWTTARGTAAPLATTQVQVTDLTTGRVLWRGSGTTGSRSLTARAGHRIRVSVTVRDASGRSSSASAVRRITR